MHLPPWGASQEAVVQGLPAMLETPVPSQGWEDPWRRKRQPTPVILAWNLTERRLAGYSPWGRKERNTTENIPVNKTCIYFSLLYFIIESFIITKNSKAKTENYMWTAPSPSTHPHPHPGKYLLEEHYTHCLNNASWIHSMLVSIITLLFLWLAKYSW